MNKKLLLLSLLVAMPFAAQSYNSKSDNDAMTPDAAQFLKSYNAGMLAASLITNDSELFAKFIKDGAQISIEQTLELRRKFVNCQIMGLVERHWTYRNECNNIEAMSRELVNRLAKK